jgi:hypothetical protein
VCLSLSVAIIVVVSEIALTNFILFHYIFVCDKNIVLYNTRLECFSKFLEERPTILDETRLYSFSLSSLQI